MRHQGIDRYDALGAGATEGKDLPDHTSKLFAAGYNLEPIRSDLASFSPQMTGDYRQSERVSASAATAGGDTTRNTTVQQKEGGVSSAIKEIGSGALDELENNKSGLVKTALMAVGTTVLTVAAVKAFPITATVALIGATVYGAKNLIAAIPGWAGDIKVVSNPHEHSKEAVAKSEENLRKLGAGTLDFAVGMGAGGVTAGIMRKEVASAATALSSRSTQVMEGVSAKAPHVTTKASEAYSKAGDMSVKIGDNIASVATVLSDRSKKWASDKYTSVAAPLVNDASTAILSAARQSAASFDNAIHMTSNGLKNAGNLTLSTGKDWVKGGVEKGVEYAGIAKPYLEQAMDKARSSSAAFNEKVASEARRFGVDVAAANLMRQAQRALNDTDNLKTVGFWRTLDGKFQEQIVQHANGQLFAVSGSGGSAFAAPRRARSITPEHIASVERAVNPKMIWTAAPDAGVPKNITLSPDTVRMYRYMVKESKGYA